MAIFIVLALVLLVLAIFILAAAGFLALVSAFKGGSVSYGGNSVSYNLQGKIGYMGFEVKWVYWNFLGMDVPYVEFLMTINGNEILSVNIGIVTESGELKDPPAEGYPDPDLTFNLLDFFGAAALVIGILGGLLFLWVPLSWIVWTLISIAILVASTIASLIFLFTQLETKAAFLGSALGFGITITLLVYALFKNLPLLVSLPLLFGITSIGWA